MDSQNLCVQPLLCAFTSKSLTGNVMSCDCPARALDLKEKVDRGERLNEWDTEYLERIITDAQDALDLIDRHPEYQALYVRVADLYEEITHKALENEQGTNSGD